MRSSTRCRSITKSGLWALMVMAGACSVARTTSQNPNVLLIIGDDLRPTLGCYGDPQAVTPFLDSLAADGTVFERAYAQQALCAPSRNSFLTSRRPDTLTLYDFYSYWRETVGNFTTLPQYFKEHGYHTKSVGKIFHPGVSSNFTDDQPYSWSETPFHPSTEVYKNAPVCPNLYNSTAPLGKNIVCPVDVTSQPGGTLPDLESAREAVTFIRAHGRREKPFFLAVGFHKPHIPLKYPSHFKRFHPLHRVKLPKCRRKPEGMPVVAWNPWTDLRDRQDIQALNLSFPFEPIPDDESKLIIQSYYAAVTYMDDMLGKVINALRQTSLYDNTIIAVIGDHGWSLGEHGEWSKYSNFEVATRVPWILKSQKQTDPRRFKSPVALVDLAPTLIEIAGLPPLTECPRPSKYVIACTEGVSRARPSSEDATVVISQYPRPGVRPTRRPNSDKPRLKGIRIMGYSARTTRFRYTEWIPFVELKPCWNCTTVAVELYDHVTDPEEENNLAEVKGLTRMSEHLRTVLREHTDELTIPLIHKNKKRV